LLFVIRSMRSNKVDLPELFRPMIKLSSNDRIHYVKAKIAQMYFVELKSQKEIANLVNKSKSAVNRIINDFKSGQDEMVTIYINTPKCIDLEHQVMEKLGYHVEKVRISSGVGIRKNLHNVSVVGAEAFIDALLDMDKGEVIDIYVSCGSTTRALIDCFLMHLQHDDKLKKSLKDTNINIYPTAIFAGFKVSQAMPIYSSLKLAKGMERILKNDKVSTFLSALPNNFATATEHEKSILLRYLGYKVFEPKLSNNNIFLLGVGSARGKDYVELATRTGILPKQNNIFSEKQAEINYQPFLENGDLCEYSGKIEGLRMDQLREFAKHGNSKVILVFGGKNKSILTRSALGRSDFYNVLCTDMDIVQEIVNFDDSRNRIERVTHLSSA